MSDRPGGRSWSIYPRQVYYIIIMWRDVRLAEEYRSTTRTVGTKRLVDKSFHGATGWALCGLQSYREHRVDIKRRPTTAITSGPCATRRNHAEKDLGGPPSKIAYAASGVHTDRWATREPRNAHTTTFCSCEEFIYFILIYSFIFFISNNKRPSGTEYRKKKLNFTYIIINLKWGSRINSYDTIENNKNARNNNSYELYIIHYMVFFLAYNHWNNSNSNVFVFSTRIHNKTNAGSFKRTYNNGKICFFFFDRGVYKNKK